MNSPQDLVHENDEQGDDDAVVVEHGGSRAPILVRSDSEDRREQRRKRRRKVRRMLRAGVPSFFGLLTANYDNSDDEQANALENLVVVVKEETQQDEKTAPETAVPRRRPKRIRIDVDAALGLKQTAVIKTELYEPTTVVATATPADEGWYEGVVSPMALPADADHLPALQVWARQHLELFSATSEDAATTQTGRRSIVPGRVGVRCVHCAQARNNQDAGTSTAATPTPDGIVSSAAWSKPAAWPIGAVSYPANLAGFHSLCSQKPALHFERHCPNLSHAERATLDQLLHNPERKRGMSLALYYACWARQIGLVDAPNEGGVRYGRDLTLEPLPLETIKRQLQESSEEAAPSTTTATRILADEESERVLAQAVMEPDDLSLCTSRDKTTVTDYMFLTIRQMKICHACPWDLTSRGKRSKVLRLGFAGFCCRHCGDECRSFASAADNLVSAISNSFATHLQKCYQVPPSIKKAIAAYKRIHARQMAQLPYGSQRKLVHELWARLRRADKTEEEMRELLKTMPKPAPKPAFSALPSASPKVSSSRARSTVSTEAPATRPESFPVSPDPETASILAQAENDWDTATNDGLILPSDRNLVSDYVFLTMRQLKAIPPTADIRRARQAGLSCIHCHDQDQHLSTPAGRSFPSAPDNYASALNTSFYNHMQQCYFIPANLKRALAHTRKIHSAQCSSLKFGSQRKYFNMLFARLGAYHQDAPSEAPPADKGRFGFLEVPSQAGVMHICVNCRMVPLQFRAPGSVLYGRARETKMAEHKRVCRGDEFDFTGTEGLLQQAIHKYCQGDMSVVLSASFRNVIRQATGNHGALSNLLTSGVGRVQRDQSGRTLDAGVADAMLSSKGLWRCLPLETDWNAVDAAFAQFASEHGDLTGRCLQECPEFLGFLQLISPSLEVPSSNETRRDTSPSETKTTETDAPEAPLLRLTGQDAPEAKTDVHQSTDKEESQVVFRKPAPI